MKRLCGVYFCLIVLVLSMFSACGSQPPTASHTPIPAHSPQKISTRVPTSTPVSRIGEPVRLLISAIGLNAPVENVGVVAGGDLQTPPQHPWDDVGWYQNGPRPGESGSAVIDGHLDRPGGYPAVFWNLRYVHVGDIVLVTNSQGNTLHFRVTSVMAYPPSQAPIQQIFGLTGGTFLNLITCAGTWIPAQHQTTLRLVVYTVMI